MKSEKGMGLVRFVLLMIVLIFILGVTIYLVVGKNGVLDPEKVKPLNSVNETVVSI